MFRATLIIFALVAVASSQRDFINKCSLSAPDLDQCFVKNGNIAIETLVSGVEDLEIPNLDGFDLGDFFLKLGNDVSFLLEDGKSFPKGLRLENAKLKFGSKKQLKSLELAFGLTDVAWEVKYTALGFFENHKVNEQGLARINFGEFKGNYTVDFRREKANDVNYLKAYNHRGIIEYEKYEFLPRNVKAAGAPLRPENFQQLEESVSDKAVEVGLELVTFAFNQILQEIPENELFLP